MIKLSPLFRTFTAPRQNFSAARLRPAAVLAAIALAASLPSEALAADLDGAKLGLAWGLPFVGILLSIALFPLFAPHFWEHHHGKIAQSPVS